jgi:hypothetical protein
MLDKFIAIFRNGPYTAGTTRTDRGYGAEPNSFGRPYAPIASGLYGPRRNVQKSFNVLPMQGDLIVAQSLPKVDLRGNAVYFAGTFGNTPLTAPGNT